MELVKKEQCQGLFFDHVSAWLLMPFVKNYFPKYQDSQVLLSTLSPSCTYWLREAFCMDPPGRGTTWGMGTLRSDCLSSPFLIHTALHLSSQTSLSRNLTLVTRPITIEMKEVKSSEGK